MDEVHGEFLNMQGPRGLRLWWRRMTIPHRSYDGHFFQRTEVRLGSLDRLLVALGRKIVIETLTEYEVPSETFEKFGKMSTEAWTEPRLWGR